MILGVVLAGGQSRRFGSDKALVEVNGHSLLATAVDTLAGWCEHVVVAGRETAPAPTLPDWPRSGMGPLGGLAAALRLAADEGYSAVLSCGVDSLGLPDDLPTLLDPAPAFVAQQPIIGLWPATSVHILEALLHDEPPHSMARFSVATGARKIELARPPANVNTPADLAAWQGGDRN